MNQNIYSDLALPTLYETEGVYIEIINVHYRELQKNRCDIDRTVYGEAIYHAIQELNDIRAEINKRKISTMI